MWFLSEADGWWFQTCSFSNSFRIKIRHTNVGADKDPPSSRCVNKNWGQICFFFRSTSLVLLCVREWMTKITVVVIDYGNICHICRIAHERYLRSISISETQPSRSHASISSWPRTLPTEWHVSWHSHGALVVSGMIWRASKRGMRSIDWSKGKIIGNLHMSWENLWFPVDFTLSQSIDNAIKGTEKRTIWQIWHVICARCDSEWCRKMSFRGLMLHFTTHLCTVPIILSTSNHWMYSSSSLSDVFTSIFTCFLVDPFVY